MSGGFHPFHAGHADLYQQAKEAFPDAKVLVCATNAQEERPFPFALKKKLAQLSGVPPKDFIEVSRQFTAQDPALAKLIGDPNNSIVIYVRSDKDRNEPPIPWKLGPDGKPPVGKRGPKKGLPLSDYLLEYPGEGQPLDPVSKHAYMAYLKTVKFGPGITSASQIREKWPTLNDKRKTAMVMSLYPATQSNPQLAQNVVGMFDQVMGAELTEGWKEKVGAAALAGGVALGGLSSMGKSADNNWDKFPQQIRTQQDNKGNEKIMSVAGPNSKGEYRVRITADDDMHEFITKTPPKGLKEEFRPSTNQAMNIHRQTTQKINPGTNKFIWKRPNQISGSHTENELKSLNFKYSMKYNMWGGTQQMWDRLTGKVNEFAPPATDRGGDGGSENERSRRLRKLLEIAIRVAEEQNVGTLDMIPAMNKIAGDDFFSVAVEGILPDITNKEYMFVIQSAYKTVKQGMMEGLGIPYPTTYEQENNKFKGRGPMRITAMTEFAPPGSDDREPDEEEILRQLAAQWWNGTEQQMKKAQQTLQAMGWDIGQDESGDDDAGVFVIRIGDEHGDSYIAFNHSDLDLNEDYLNEK